jgi:N-acetylneuraminate synthase/N,N'-diacetyllegionaminate synthase
MFDVDGITIGTGERPMVIAEVGVNAYDDLELAKAFIDAAADSGADAVKFQTHMADEEMAKWEMERIGAEDVYEVVTRSEWSVGEHEELQAHCTEAGLTFLSTPFSCAGVDLLNDLGVPAIKIGSGELTNFEILERTANTGKPLLVSTGMSDLETIDRTCDFLAERAATFAFLYCVSAYPTAPEDIHLDTIEGLRDRYDVPIGFSDHSTGIEASVLSLGHDVALIEKHFTLDRRLPGPDQAVSIEPEELERLTDFVEYSQLAAGEDTSLRDEESAIKEWARHSVVASTDIAAGDRLSRENVTTKRPGTGIPANEYIELLGRRAARTIERGKVLQKDDID